MDSFEIGGKTFHLAGESTARHDMYTMRQIAACGVNMVGQQEAESEEQFQYRLYRTALNTGDLFLLLGSLLVPEGTAPNGWTEQMAKDTANFLGNLTAEADKAKIRVLLASALLPFFVAGRRSLKTSPKSSSPLGSGLHPLASAGTASTETGV